MHRVDNIARKKTIIDSHFIIEAGHWICMTLLLWTYDSFLILGSDNFSSSLPNHSGSYSLAVGNKMN